MPRRFRLKTTRGTDTEEHGGEFTDSDWTVLSRYLACAHRLARCHILETQSQLRIHFRAEKGQCSTFETNLPPETDVAEFLLRLRPFILADEDTNFYRVRNLLARYVPLTSFRGYLDGLRDGYSGKELPFRIVVGSPAGEIALTSEEALLKWLNAFEYHQDADKQAELEAMYSVFPEHTSRAIFLYSLLQRGNAIGKLGAIIDGFSKQEGRETEAR